MIKVQFVHKGFIITQVIWMKNIEKLADYFNSTSDTV